MDTAKFIGMMTGQGNVSQPMPIEADVSFWNANFLGATMEDGHFQLFYDSEVMGHGRTAPMHVAPRSTGNVHVSTTITLNQALASKIMADVLANNFRLKVSADMHGIAKVGWLSVKTHVQCETVAASLTLIQGGSAEDLLVQKHCTYTYSL